MNGNRAKHKHLKSHAEETGLAQGFGQGLGGAELLGAVGQVAVGVGFASDEAAQGGDHNVEVEQDEGAEQVALRGTGFEDDDAAAGLQHSHLFP